MMRILERYFSKRYGVFLICCIIWLLFSGLAYGGVSAKFGDWAFLKFVFWIALVIGGWVVSGIVSHTIVKMKVKVHDDMIADLVKLQNELSSSINRKLYDKNGRLLYMQKEDCRLEKEEKERRQDKSHRFLCNKIDKLEKIVSDFITFQSELSTSIKLLSSRMDQYLDEEKKYKDNTLKDISSKISKLADVVEDKLK